MYSIQLKTAHGPAAFTFTLTPEGKAIKVTCLMLDLPPAGLQLTYPNADPDELKKQFNAWEIALPYFVEVAIWQEEPPEYLAGVREQFVAQHPEYSAMRNTVLAIDPLEEDVPHRHWKRVSAWFRMGVQRSISTFPERSKRDDVIITGDKLSLHYRRLAAEWLIITFPLAPQQRIDDWLVAIGKTRTAEGNEFLFKQLERPGVLPYDRQIYTVLANSRLKLPVSRITRLYDQEDKMRDAIKTYIHLLNRLPYPEVRDLLLRIVEEHPTESFGAVKRFARHDMDVAYEMLLRIFNGSKKYRTVMAILSHMVRLVGPEKYMIDLRSVNARLADRSLHLDAQVTWPQKLHDAWREILLRTSPRDFSEVINEFLPTARGPVARNMLLQLKEYLTANDPSSLSLSILSEEALLDLVNSRRDKISTVAIDVIRLLFQNLRNRKQATMVLLEHIETSRYRMMDAAALRVAAAEPEYYTLQVGYFTNRIATAKFEPEISNLRRAVTHLRHLPRWEELSKQAEREEE